MAEGLAKSIFGTAIEVESAGSKPTSLNPFAIEVMKNIDIDISTQRSKGMGEVLDQAVDVVITLCAEEVCPVLSHPATKERWPLPDPAAATGHHSTKLGQFEKIREMIKERILDFGERYQIKIP